MWKFANTEKKITCKDKAYFLSVSIVFLFINKILRLDNLKTAAATNAKISAFLICVEATVYLLLYSLHDCTFKNYSTVKTMLLFLQKMKQFLIQLHWQLFWVIFCSWLIKSGESSRLSFGFKSLEKQHFCQVFLWLILMVCC